MYLLSTCEIIWVLFADFIVRGVIELLRPSTNIVILIYVNTVSVDVILRMISGCVIDVILCFVGESVRRNT